jgi:hypothetical protein
MKTILLLITLSLACSAFAGDRQADGYGNTDKSKCWWKHQAVWSKETDGITFYERESCAHRLAYPYAYTHVPRQ